MTSQTPDEALHFRGKTLTPESPRPLHISEPSNIPVLQNQMDPSYNDTSAFEGLSGVKAVTTSASGAKDGVRLAEQYSPNACSFMQSESGNMTSGWIGQEDTGSFPRSNKEDGLQSNDESVISSPHSGILTNQFTSPVPDAFLRVVAPEEQPLSQLDPNPVLDRSMPPDITQPNPAPSLTSYETHQPQRGTGFNNVSSAQAGLSTNAQRDMISDNGAADVPEGGVNYASLLNNIASSSSATPMASPTVTTTPSPAENSNLLPATTESSLPYSSGLPPRPPPQEKPAIHPSYSSTDNIRSFHPTHNTAPNGISQYESSNLPQASGYAPIVAPNGLLPPPPATFQQSQTSNTQVAKTFDTTIRNEDYDDNLEDSQGEHQEAPWAPEVQKKYDEFLRDERVYVTEGLWDRFPYGSRLFVGMYYYSTNTPRK